MKIAALYVYPVKSCRGLAVTERHATDFGLEGDREYVITTADGHFVTQRQLPKMATLQPRFEADDLFLTGDGVGTIHLSAPGAGRGKVTVWDDTTLAEDLGAAAAEFVTTYLGPYKDQGLKIWRLCKDHPRLVPATYTGTRQVPYGFADGFPYLVISEASLEALNLRLRAKGSPELPMNRFRPNIVLSGTAAFFEDHVPGLTIDARVSLTLAHPCVRCSITTVDQDTGREQGAEPLATLAEFRRSKPLKGVLFGQNAFVTTGAGERIAVGDEVVAMS